MNIKKEYDFVVIGGGISGMCAAIASARQGVKTALIQDRPVLGGNASSEMRMHVCGADYHSSRPNARETGIVEELLLEHKHRNINNSYPIFDSVLWEKAAFQENLSLYLNTRMLDVTMNKDIIVSVVAEQMTTEKRFEISAKLFADASGDGVLGAKAGAEYVIGREAQSEYDEKHAPEKADEYTMGNSLMFQARDIGKPAPFTKPFWANTYTEEDLKLRDHSAISAGYWWIELGGGKWNVIDDAEIIRDELTKAVFGVWDHIKNGGNHGAENYELEWVGFLPSKRESRRFIGDYVLNENDCVDGTHFSDAVAYGGWPIDVHTVEGFLSNDDEPTMYIYLKDVYEIPYRTLYSKNIKNLFLAGRIISCSHMAFASTRVMGTCAVVGQAVGTAAAMAIDKHQLPKEISQNIVELQQKLLKQDCYIPGVRSQDAEDIALVAAVSSSHNLAGFEAAKVTNGIARQVHAESNCWRAPLAENPWLSLKFEGKQQLCEVRLTFDSNLSREITISIIDEVKARQSVSTPEEIVKAFKIGFYLNGEKIGEETVKDNHLRHCVVQLGDAIMCDEIRVEEFKTHGAEFVSVFEMRAYTNWH